MKLLSFLLFFSAINNSEVDAAGSDRFFFFWLSLKYFLNVLLALLGVG